MLQPGAYRRVVLGIYQWRDIGILVLLAFLHLKLGWSFAYAHMPSFPDCHEIRQFFYHMLLHGVLLQFKTKGNCPKNHVFQSLKLWKDCLKYFDPVTQVYQQMEPVTKCKHQVVDVTSVPQASVGWNVFFIWEVKELWIGMTWMTVEGGHEWPHLPAYLFSPFSKQHQLHRVQLRKPGHQIDHLHPALVWTTIKALRSGSPMSTELKELSSACWYLYQNSKKIAFSIIHYLKLRVSWKVQVVGCWKDVWFPVLHMWIL